MTGKKVKGIGKEVEVDVDNPSESFRRMLEESASTSVSQSQSQSRSRSFSPGTHESPGALEGDPATPTLSHDDLCSARSHTRHLSVEQFDVIQRTSSYNKMELSRPSLILGTTERPGHYRRQSVNPLERAAEDVFLSTQLETSRSAALWSPTKTKTGRYSFERALTAERKEPSQGDDPRAPPAGSQRSIFSFPSPREDEDEAEDGARCIEIGIPNYIPDDAYCSNAIITAKYNVFSFLPIFLFKMFSRVAYLYFLFQAALTFWQAISPYKPWGPTAGLAFVLLVAAVKEIIEDRKRHQADLRTNTSLTHVIQPDGSFSEKEWRQVKVGDIVQVNDGDLIPADLLCLHTALPDQVCFVKTANLDGESNLKIKRPVTLLDEDGHDLDYHSGRSDESVTQEDESEGPSSPPLTSPATYRKEFMPIEWMTSIFKIKATVHVEQPSENLQNICGFVECDRSAAGVEDSGEDQVVPITMNEMLLRGCMLKNSGFVLGLVVYTGRETRIQMNNRNVPFKLGSFESYLNTQIILLLFLQFSVCVGCAIGALLWREDQGMFRYYLAMDSHNWDSNNENPFVFVVLSVLTNWILYSFMIPISLFVSNEIVKFWQTFVYINQDKEMVDPLTDEAARSRNSNVVEDLGKINFVFSDKTGTLTSNEMRLRAVGIGGLSFGSKDRRLELRPELQGREALEFFDSHLAKSLDYQRAVDPDLPSEGNSKYDYVTVTRERDGQESIDYEKLGTILYEFFLSICICHSLIVEGSEDKPSFQGPSPDEVALVEAAQQLGFEFLQRSSKHVKLAFHGREFTFEVLNVLEFTSERRKMSVVARGPDGVIRLFCKGADSAIMSCLRNYKFLPDGDALVESTHESLSNFACQGLRTLCVASKVLEEEYWEEWDEKYQEAAACIDDRDSRVASCAQELEVDLNLLGITAIEDKLQEGVPETIQLLSNAGIKVFMITGDKQETAISIAISCNLIQNSDAVMICNESSTKDAKKKLKEFVKDCGQSKYYTSGYLDASSRKEFVIDGPTLDHVLGTETEKVFAELASRCASVVICRASPAQKSAVVRVMKEYQMFSHSKWYSEKQPMPKIARWYYKMLWKVWDGRMLAIGDGANDVAMLQSSDVGIGILGKEGRQAVNNSDFAIGQFRFLGRLLLVHGQLSYYRLAHLIKYSFYKNISFALVFFYYQFFCGFSGQAIIDSYKATVFNVVLSSLPILILATVDKPAEMKSLMDHPQTYNNSRALSTWNFWKAALLKSTMTSALAFFVPYFSTSISGVYGAEDIYSLGTTIFIALLGIIGIEILMLSKSWTWIFVVATVLSYVLAFVFVPLWEALLNAFNYPQPEYGGIAKVLYASPSFWLQLLLCYCVAFGWRFIDRAVKLHLFPDDYDVLAELHLKRRRTAKRSKSSQPTPAVEIEIEGAPEN
ncbi:phospholipid-translocating P-type ATPase [Chloropicon primus]|uniref:Phospholipid-transporting ATPase n=1 Tax=Chloropicon primus TaxID=1764295 RepID=A0A5B8MJ64_9CHLO|nr:phospholipid-translocating P-type ATPase [Chloropicon primus]UPQ99346.1 phospholipid-translocating P-type ATPase [Chloropicon primus]|mmetsp:Transcript_8254/g.23605  ORF Transcript_8254/g.23605 Transcript_8254/m.23605 type:complete len:1416 (+) Transcript_8254:98-4345(+)|eukprot:QDZ20134.1 phospholipid-translocating P-type ATPase [Chloropicon primus]